MDELFAEESARTDAEDCELYWQEVLASDPDYVYWLEGLTAQAEEYDE